MIRRNRNYDEDVNHDRWLISYAEFITLLFAFFVDMYAISSVSEGKYRVISDSISEIFDNTKGVATVIPSPIELPIEQRLPFDQVEGKNQGVQIEGVNEKVLNEVKEAPEEIVNPSTGEGIAEGDRIRKSLGEIADDIRYELIPFIDDDLVLVNNTENKIEIEIKSEMLFASGEARLKSDVIPVLSNMATIMSTFNNPIQVEGFTDNQSIKSLTFPSNWELSAARAASVVHLLMRKGIDPERMSATGYAEFKPVADNSTKEGRQKNRRVMIIIPTSSDERQTIN